MQVRLLKPAASSAELSIARRRLRPRRQGPLPLGALPRMEEVVAVPLGYLKVGEVALLIDLLQVSAVAIQLRHREAPTTPG